MMMSPSSRCGSSLAMKSSTAGPALTSRMILRGRLSFLQRSSIECAPITLVPARSASTSTIGRRALGLVLHEVVDLGHGAVERDDGVALKGQRGGESWRPTLSFICEGQRCSRSVADARSK